MSGGEMGFWSVLAGAAIGVGAVAAAPFTGGGSVLGAATLVSSLSGAGALAAGAAVAGGVAGASVGGGDEVDKESFEKGKLQGKAENSIELERMKAKLKAVLAQSSDTNEYLNSIIAMQAVAVACAHCDGEFAPEERRQIEAFIGTLSQNAAPKGLIERVQQLYDNPPNIKEAHLLASRSIVDMATFDTIIETVMLADGVVHKNETAFLQAWQQLSKA